MKRRNPRQLRSYWNTSAANEEYRHIFHAVLRGGRARLSPMYHLESWAHPGHDLILSYAGSGTVRIGNQAYALRAGQLAWINYNRLRLHVLWPSRSGPWEYMFVRVNSSQLDLMADILMVQTNPIFSLENPRPAVGIFGRIFGLLHDRPLSMAASLHAAVTALVALLFECRQAAASLDRVESQGPRYISNFERLIDAMRSDLGREWNVRELARLRRMSLPHFYRRFAQATGTTPMAWLQRERINRAKQRLVETDDRICAIAVDVGYLDPLYFSRHFRKLVGMGPRAYRKLEHLRSDLDSNHD
jgi:AraC family transcriptional regulator, arabinose operon regulatory protein